MKNDTIIERAPYMGGDTKILGQGAMTIPDKLDKQIARKRMGVNCHWTEDFEQAWKLWEELPLKTKNDAVVIFTFNNLSRVRRDICNLWLAWKKG